MKLPKTHTAVVGIRDHDDAQSVAAAAASAALSLLTKVSAEQRGDVLIDHVSITQPEQVTGFGVVDFMTGNPAAGKYAVVVTARVKEPEQPKPTEDA